MTPTRPALRWHGGKWMLAPWVISHFPPHRIYTETFGGAGSVLFRKVRAYCEVWNDLDSDVVNFFRVLRDPGLAECLLNAIALTPFARDEFELSYEHTNNQVERARRLAIRCYMGFGSDGHNAEVRTGFRSNSYKSGTTPAGDWANYPECLRLTINRFRGVVIENRPAMQVLHQHDSIETLHYLDPPYLPAVRSQKSRRGKIRYHAYRHEMTEDDHRELLDYAHTLKGMVVLSGYPSKIYDDALGGWDRVERKAMADGARERTEVLWRNPACMDQMKGLFD